MFAKDKSRRDELTGACKACRSERNRTWYANAGRQWKEGYEKANPVLKMTSSMLRHARDRAKGKNLPFDIDLHYVRSMVGENAEFASHCPVFGITLEWSCRRNQGNAPHPYAPSLDRIDPERGYVKGNVWIISHRANTIKSNATHEELKLVTKAVGKAIVDSLEF